MGNDDWDDSVLTKEEIETRMQRKVEALVKRERAMAYAYSHQVFYLHEQIPFSISSLGLVKSNFLSLVVSLGDSCGKAVLNPLKHL